MLSCKRSVRAPRSRLCSNEKCGFTTLIAVPYVVVVIDIEPIRERFSAVAPFLDERGRGLVAAAEAFAAGYGGDRGGRGSDGGCTQ